MATKLDSRELQADPLFSQMGKSRSPERSFFFFSEMPSETVVEFHQPCNVTFTSVTFD